MNFSTGKQVDGRPYEWVVELVCRGVEASWVPGSVARAGGWMDGC
jgi:hypothetical protein